MVDSLAVAHQAGYAHGLVIGIVFGGILGCTAGLFLLALAVAARDGDRAIEIVPVPGPPSSRPLVLLNPERPRRPA